MDNYLFKEFAMDFPVFAEHTVAWHEDFIETLVVKLDDGGMFEYSRIDRTIRSLPLDEAKMTKDECKHEFAYRLRNLLIYKYMTQSDLAQITQIPQSQISNYITGKSLPDFYNLDKIAKALDVSIDAFRYRG